MIKQAGHRCNLFVLSVEPPLRQGIVLSVEPPLRQGIGELPKLNLLFYYLKPLNIVVKLAT